MIFDHLELFATPLFVFDMPETGALNHDLRTRLVAESQQTAGIQRSNIGGWHSVPDLGQRSESCYQTIIGMIVERIQTACANAAERADIVIPGPYRFGVQSWAMVMGLGDYVIPHDHANAHWSVAYYVDAGDEVDAHPESGLLTFIDPCRSPLAIPGLDLPPSTFTVKPRSGTLVVFPGSLQHYVHPYRGQRARVCISCNITMAPAW